MGGLSLGWAVPDPMTFSSLRASSPPSLVVLASPLGLEWESSERCLTGRW